MCGIQSDILVLLMSAKYHDNSMYTCTTKCKYGLYVYMAPAITKLWFTSTKQPNSATPDK